jgi:hypothetical protein
MNLNAMPITDVKARAHGLFTVNTQVDIPPGKDQTITKDCPLSGPLRLFAMTGHFHKRGKHFTVETFDVNDPILGPTLTGDFIYDSRDWNNAPFTTFDPALDPRVELIGNPDATGAGVHFTCSYLNDCATSSNTCNDYVTWGSHADVQEHCNLFMWYYPLAEVTDANGRVTGYAPDPQLDTPITCPHANGW